MVSCVPLRSVVFVGCSIPALCFQISLAVLLGNAFGVRGQAWESNECPKWINKIEVCIETDFGGYPEGLNIGQESVDGVGGGQGLE